MMELISLVVLTVLGCGAVLSFWNFFESKIRALRVENICTNRLASFLLSVRDATEEVTEIGKISVIQTTYNIPAGDALVEFFNLANKKHKTNEEYLFFNDVVEMLNSLETIKYTSTKVAN